MIDKKILVACGYEKTNENEYTLELEYSGALNYFSLDSETTEFLENLEQDEKENLVLHSIVDTKRKYAKYRLGNRCENSKNLKQLGNGIDNTTEEDEFYIDVLDTCKDLIDFTYDKEIYGDITDIQPIGNSSGVIIPAKNLKNNNIKNGSTVHVTVRKVGIKKKSREKIKIYVVGQLDKREVTAMVTNEDILTVVDTQKHAEQIRKHGYKLPNHVYKKMIE